MPVARSYLKLCTKSILHTRPRSASPRTGLLLDFSLCDIQRSDSYHKMTINTWGEVETRFFSFGTFWRLKPLSVTVSQVYTFRGCFWGKTSRFSCPIRVTLLKAETQQRYIEALGTFGFFILLPTSHTNSSSACRWVCTIWGQQRHSIGPLIRHPCRMLLMNAAPRYLVGLLVSFANSRTDICTRGDDTFSNDLLGYVPMTNGIRAFWSVFRKNPTWYLDRVYCTHTKLLLFRSSSP